MASVFDTRADAQAATIPAADDTLIINGYSSAGDGGAAVYKRLSAPPSPSNAWTFQSGSGSGPWWELAENRPNIRMFGAVGNGVTPDTVAVQNAVDACIALKKPLQVPIGSYVVGPIYLNGSTWKTKKDQWLAAWNVWQAAHPGSTYQQYLDQYYATDPQNYLLKNPDAGQQPCLKALIGEGAIWYGSRFLAQANAYGTPGTYGLNPNTNKKEFQNVGPAVLTLRNAGASVVQGVHVDAASNADVCIDAAWIGTSDGVPDSVAPACDNTFRDWFCESARLKGVLLDQAADCDISNINYRGGNAVVAISMKLPGGGIWANNLHVYQGRVDIAAQNACISDSVLLKGIQVVSASFDLLEFKSCQFSTDPDTGYTVYSNTDTGSFGTSAIDFTSCYFLGGATHIAYFAGRWACGANFTASHFEKMGYFATDFSANGGPNLPVFDFKHCSFIGGSSAYPASVPDKVHVGTYACRRGDGIVIPRRDFPKGAKFREGVFVCGEGPGAIPADAYTGLSYNRSASLGETEVYQRGDILRFVKWDGTTAAVQYTFNNTATSAFYPATDNVRKLGQAGNRWTEVFAANGTINTSDARTKTEVSPLTGAEIEAGKALAKEIGTYRFLDAVAAKGEAARLHPGLTVQRAIEILAAHGLDPMRYGFICHDAWDEEVTEHPAVTDETGAEIASARTERKPAGDLYGFRPDELMLFIARGLEARLEALEAAATA